MSEKQGLSQRAQQVLTAVIVNYVLTALPVGSRTVARQAGLEVSPATIRNVMAELEERGLLAQPHTSAGRVPPREGLRFYIDSILEVRELDAGAKERLKGSLLANRPQELTEVLKATSRVLSNLSQQVAVVALPGPEQEVFRHIEFILLHPGVILVVLVSKAGGVQNRIIEAEATLGQEDLDKFSRYLNELLADLTLSEVRDRVAQEMAKEKARFDHLVGQALSLGQKALAPEPGGEVLIEGRNHLLAAPEFADVAKLKHIFTAFEEKSTLLRLLEKSLSAHGVQIFIGVESELYGLEGLTAVTSPYGDEKTPLGALGVIGPTRMDYSRVIPMVDYTAKLVSRVLNPRG